MLALSVYRLLPNRYNDVFGSPISLALGAGWVTELVARLSHTPVKVHDTTTNATLHNPVQFPLNDALYVDVTHEVRSPFELSADCLLMVCA